MNMNDYGVWLLGAAIIGFFFFRTMRGRIGAERARQMIKEGAVLLDVRTSGEFAQGRIRGTKNVPLDELRHRIVKMVPDKNTGILCHCASGMRSGAAASQLRGMGYTRAFNLGSFQRAGSLVSEAGKGG